MTKDQIKEALKKQNLFDTNSKHNLWIDAFNAYKTATGQKLSLSCGSCFTKVRQWLNS